MNDTPHTHTPTNENQTKMTVVRIEIQENGKVNSTKGRESVTV